MDWLMNLLKEIPNEARCKDDLMKLAADHEKLRGEAAEKDERITALEKELKTCIDRNSPKQLKVNLGHENAKKRRYTKP